MLKVFSVAIVALLGVLALIWISQGNELFMLKVFGPRYQNTKREIFEQSYSYNRSLAGDLIDLRRQYDSTKDENVKAAIATAVNAKVAGYDLHQLHDPELAAWTRGLR